MNAMMVVLAMKTLSVLTLLAVSLVNVKLVTVEMVSHVTVSVNNFIVLYQIFACYIEVISPTAHQPYLNRTWTIYE